jgi:hypothetical protein
MQWKMKKVAGIGYSGQGIMMKKERRGGFCMECLHEQFEI